ncbi:MAG: response regulator [Proteobacteria bacterium]|nr:response regulator [Pseudomonadota bacterium]
MKVGLPELRVLIADDSEGARALLAGMLLGIGITQVRQAPNGSEAYQVLRHWTADLAFVDLNMPLVDGIEFIKLVRTAPESPAPYLPIVLITGAAHLTRITEARDAGVNEVLVKPVSPQVVVERLRAVIESKRRFVRTETYVGPDRRRRSRSDHQGPWRREDDQKPSRTGRP